VNAINQEKELSIEFPENGQYMVLTNVFYVLRNPQKFMDHCRKLLSDSEKEEKESK